MLSGIELVAAGVEKLEKEIARRRKEGAESKAERRRERSLINNPKSELPSSLVQRGSMENGMRVNSEATLHACFGIQHSVPL